MVFMSVGRVRNIGLVVGSVAVGRVLVGMESGMDKIESGRGMVEWGG